MKRVIIISIAMSVALSGCLAVENQILGEEAVKANHEQLVRSYMSLDCRSLKLQEQSLSAVKRPGMVLIHPATRAHGQKQLAAAEAAIKRKGCR